MSLLIIQEDLADRIVAKPGSKKNSSLAIFSQFYFHIEKLFLIPPTAFYPKPKIESRVIKLTLKEIPKVHEEAFFQFVRKAFGQKRKMLRNTMREEKLGELLVKKGYKETTRPEDLGVNDYLQLFLALPPQS